MIGRIQCRSSSNNTGANNYSRNANNNRTLPVKNTKCQDTFQKAKTNSRRRRAEISSIKRGERHLLIDGEVRPHNIRKQSRKKRDAKMRKKKTRNRNGGDTETPLTSYRDDTQINCNNTEEYNCDIDMSDHSSGGQFPIKKRGHQHHPRFAGQRRSNVPAEEVLAALRRGGVIEMSKVLTADILVDPPPPPPLEGQHNQHVTSGGERESHDSDADNVICQTLRNTVIDNSDDCEDFNRNVIGCVTTEQLLVCDEENNAISRTATSALPDEPVTTTNSCDTSLPSSFSTEVLATKPKNDDIYLSQQPKTKSNKSKNRDKQKDGKSSKSDEKKKRRQQKENQNPGDIPRYERSEGDGAPNDGAENDPETEEWSRLRCTSERTEVIAEREHRRRKKCADYPGLAFGRSIFSSDTMMKFNIIRNELHNIMKTQLKRAESEVAALNRRIQLLEEDLERSEERLASATAKLSEASQAADESERIRKALENRTNMEDDRVAILEAQLSQAKLIAEEADKKYEEVARKLVLMEQDLERSEEKVEISESKIVELEEELRVVGNNLKSLEVSEEKATQKEETFEGQIRMLDQQLKEAEARAEFAERSVQKLQKEVDRLEDDLLNEREKNKLLQEEMEATLHDIQNM